MIDYCMRRLFSGKVFSEYAQFSLNDCSSSLAALEGIWTAAARAIHLGEAEGILAVGTGTKHGYVAVEVWLFDDRPALDTTTWDQVVEASLTTTSGCLQLTSISSEEALGSVGVGPFRVRVASGGLGRGQEVGDGGDRYRLELWPQSSAAPEALKLYAAWPR
jgi:hypothetical protein